jgi:hypothetical protein
MPALELSVGLTDVLRYDSSVSLFRMTEAIEPSAWCELDGESPMYAALKAFLEIDSELVR